MPRPAEDPNWIDAQLAGLAQARTDPIEQLARQQAARVEAWRRAERTDPGGARRLRRRLRRWAHGARDREQARSEVARVFWLVRHWVLVAGELTGDGEDLFFLTTAEISTLLRAPRAATADRLRALIPVRRATHARYAALPRYPTWIRGHFDPEAWAADPRRRRDIFDATTSSATPPPERSGEVITGYPGAAGVVQGRVRVLSTADNGDQLRPGEILVTTATNVGWTPLFPRAAALVTDIGAPLSHAAIVARELGIPAVVGCGDATTRLHTGDQVQVDGSAGTVLPLHRAPRRASTRPAR
jgi:pyruvate,water dikinase